MCSGNLHFNRISWDGAAEFGGLLTEHMAFSPQDAPGLGGRDLSSSPQQLVTQWNWLLLSGSQIP